MNDNNYPSTEIERGLVLVDQEMTELDGSDTSSESEEGKITEPFDPSKIRVETKNTTMDVLIKRLRNNEIDLAPDFQRRGGIWKDDAQSRLIESMLIKIPLPAFYLDATEDDKWLVVDGLQRLSTIKRFVIEESLCLTGLEFLNDIKDKKFRDLPRNFQRRIEETEVVMYLIQPGTPPKVKFDIFRRINTGGAPLSTQEIRHALNQGKIIKILENLADSQDFKIATAKGVSPKRMDDRECVLRFLAFTINHPDDYDTDNFDGFLNDSMAQLNHMNDAELQNLSIKFLDSMRLAKRIFGTDAFRKRYEKTTMRHPINKALFESWSVNLGQLTEKESDKLFEKKEMLKENFISLMNNRDFDIAVTQGTGSVKRVRLRFKRIRDIISEVLA
ncbi:DUF262 domain-containing protein [Desulfonatronum parangueonense]